MLRHEISSCHRQERDLNEKRRVVRKERKNRMHVIGIHSLEQVEISVNKQVVEFVVERVLKVVEKCH